jgi:uncharacterized membrane protein YvlD (DUF360 family)
MTSTVKTIVKGLIRLVILWVVDAMSLSLAAWILRGVNVTGVADYSRIVVVTSAALLLALVNLLIRPFVLLLARPLGWLITFIIGFFVNALALWITGWLLPGLEVSFWGGIFGGIAIGFFNTIITGILEINEEGSYYQNRIERLAREQPYAGADEPGVGLMMVEIDGLSYWHLQEAMQRGLLPTLQEMIEEENYQISHVDCGLPSMTSSCQAGIMFGDNYDIPAYRWYDKSQQKLYVSADDATELNARYAHGQGLMRHGSSIMNMLDGDAEKSMFTMANMFKADEKENKRRSEDISLLMLDPYFLTHEIALFFWEVGRELWEGWQQKRQDVYPRLNRLAHGYPFLRAAMCTFMRDVSANIAIMDMMRGAPSIYMLYLGYDEVAHHSGPWTSDAFGDLRRLDATFARLRRAVNERAPRPYDLIVLSDHGQSFGPTFLQRYGITVKELIEQNLPKGISVSQIMGGDTGGMGLQSVAQELTNAAQGDSGTAFDKAMARQGAKLADRGADINDAVDEHAIGDPTSVTAYGSGNAAQVYFDLFPRKILLSELNAVYPGMIDAVVAHEGIGLVLGYEDDGSILAIGQDGTHNLNTGEVIGEDPVAPYAGESGHGAGALELRIWQLKRVMEFPNAGDLWLISTVYEDGTVAALEELIGSHGGLGGEQTDAFIFHPPEMEVPPTRNSTDVFHILDAHRNAPVVKRVPDVEEELDAVPDWAPSTLATGIGQVGTWFDRAVRCMFFDRTAHEEVADDPYMTGPALLISLTMLTFFTTLRNGFDLVRIGANVGHWLVLVMVLTGTGYLLTRRGEFTRTFRTTSFALSLYTLGILYFVPGMQPLVFPLLLLLIVLALWMAVSIASETKGWRTLLIPLFAGVVLVGGSWLLGVLLDGLRFTFEGVLYSLGIEPS